MANPTVRILIHHGPLILPAVLYTWIGKESMYMYFRKKMQSEFWLNAILLGVKYDRNCGQNCYGVLFKMNFYANVCHIFGI